MTPANRLALRLLERLRPSQLITNDEGDPYLHRFYLTPDASWWRERLRLPGLYLHYFYRGDGDRELHSHPWSWACSLVLWGGYVEHRDDEGKISARPVLPGAVNRIDGATFHRVELLRDGAWTLFLAGRSWHGEDRQGRRVSMWGFRDLAGERFEWWFDRRDRLKREREALRDPFADLKPVAPGEVR